MTSNGHNIEQPWRLAIRPVQGGLRPPRVWVAARYRGAGPWRLFLFAAGIVLLEEGNQVVGLLLVLQAGIDHLGARHFRLGIPDVFAEGGLVPGDSGFLISGRIGIAFLAARLAA